MKERPILFSGPMVRAILEGRKTQTRRIAKEKVVQWLPTLSSIEQVGMRKNGLCPYGYPGDRLWVRETFAEEAAWYGASDEVPDWWKFLYRATDEEILAVIPGEKVKWKPPIFMPREASRILLEITHDRAERLLDVSESDAIAEGFQAGDLLDIGERRFRSAETAVDSFLHTWDFIYGINSSKGNPWVWVVEFKKVQP
jgi:hypothetical protein